MGDMSLACVRSKINPLVQLSIAAGYEVFLLKICPIWTALEPRSHRICDSSEPLP